MDCWNSCGLFLSAGSKFSAELNNGFCIQGNIFPQFVVLVYSEWTFKFSMYVKHLLLHFLPSTQSTKEFTTSDLWCLLMSVMEILQLSPISAMKNTPPSIILYNSLSYSSL
jgi:hypothetical protein